VRSYKIKRSAQIDEMPQAKPEAVHRDVRQDWQPRPDREPPPPAKEPSHELPWLGSYIILLLLAPLMQDEIQFIFGTNEITSFAFSAYWPLLATAVPVLAAAYFIRPTGDLFYVAAPLLPVAAYFSLQGAVRHHWMLIPVFISMCGLPCYHFINSSKPDESEEGMRYDGEVHGRSLAQRRAYQRKALTFGVLFMTAVLAVTAVAGHAVPERPTEETEQRGENMNMIQLMEELSYWPDSVNGRNKILQSLLTWECREQNITPAYRLDDPSIREIMYDIKRDTAAKRKTYDKKRATLAARKTAEDELEERIKIICYIVHIQKQLGPAEEKGKFKRLEKNVLSEARSYAAHRVEYYMSHYSIEG